jgi:hypothetical protein
MVIHSTHIRAALAAVIGYYSPGPDQTQDLSKIDSPFRILVHRWKALEQYKLNQPACHDAEYAATTARHLDVLLAYLKETYEEKLTLESSRWNRPSGATATFDLFWVLLAPGEIVYRERHGEMVPYIVSSLDFTAGRDGKQGGFYVYMWNLKFANGRMERKETSATVDPWNGEQLISKLPVIPARFVPGGAKAMAEAQIKLGKSFWELAKQPAYKEYDGPLVFKHGKMGGRASSPVTSLGDSGSNS